MLKDVDVGCQWDLFYVCFMAANEAMYGTELNMPIHGVGYVLLQWRSLDPSGTPASPHPRK